jgi:Homeodomain-like domain
MPTPQKAPLRPLSEQEYQELLRIIRASSERLDRVRRAKAVLAVAAGKSFTGAAQQSGFKSGDSIAQLVERFNQHGLCALDIARGRGPKPTYDSAVRARILHKVQTPPDRRQDGTATWSLSTLERSLRKEGGELATLGATTIRGILYEAGYSFQRTRTWCPTGSAQRKRKEGVVTVIDPDTHEKKA